MSEQLKKKAFTNYLNTGFGEQNKAEDFGKSVSILSSFYEWNYSQLLPEDKDCKILDIGCGMGQFLSWIKNKGYKNFKGIDLSQQMVDFCRQNVTDQVEKTESIVSFLLNEKESYDLIVMLDVIEHIDKEEIIAILEAVRSALKKGGKLIVKTNNVASITGARMRYEDFTHVSGYTEYSLKQVLKIAGFNKVHLKPFAIPRTSFKRWIRFFMQLKLHCLWKLIYFMEFTAVPKIVHEFIFAIASKE